MNTKTLKKWLYLSLTCSLFVGASPLFAQIDATFEVGTGSLPATVTATATTQSPFTRINFAAPFAAGVTPNVFPMTPEFGAGVDDDPCTIRIRNINNTGFDAACLEPINEDRDSPAVNFDYIATVNGSLNVPVVGSTASVRFESNCSFVNSQVFGPTCANCVVQPFQTQGFTPQSFSTAFNSPPALLTQISSTNNAIQGGNNQPGGEPEFLEAAVQSGSVTASGFNWALDRLEAGNGSIFSGETICYLAVEQNGCQELDFSSLGGPSSVDFAALEGGNVDGHDNGATAGEGATFPAGCFTNTPVVLGNSITRNGNNGGILRLVSQNSAAAIFTIDEDRVSNTERSHIDEDIAVLAFSSTFTTPVTLSQAQVTQAGRRTTFKWETSSETFHLGFHLWGETASGWEQLNNRLILGAEIDTAETNRYQRTIRLSRSQFNEISRFGISTVDNTGFEEFYGPFELNTEYGEEANNEPVDWSTTRSEFEQTMRERGFIKKNNRWRRASNRVKRRTENRNLGVNSSVINLEFETSGLHRISASEVLNASPDWQGVAVSNLALTLNGDAAPRDIISEDAVFSADDDIVVYQLRVDRSRVREVSEFDGSLSDETDNSNTTSSAGLVSVTATSNRIYSAGIEDDEPWYDARLLSRGSAVSTNYAIDFQRPIDDSRSSFIDFTLYGGLDLPGDINDHHAQVSVNGSIIDDAVFDGLSTYTKRVELPAGLLKQTNNNVSVTVVGDTGLFADLVQVGDVVLSAPEVLADQTSYDFFVTSEDTAFSIASTNAESSSVYAYTDTGLLTRVISSKTSDSISFATLPGVDSLRSDLRFSVSAIESLPTPINIELADIKVQHRNLGDLLIVSHPSFIGEELNEYAQFKENAGYTVNIVDWLEVVETYGYGNNTPNALNNFLVQAYPDQNRSNEADSLNNILLIGGHTYDYLGYLNSEIVNFIPTHYRKVGIFDFTPSDNVFADLDKDQIPDLTIGRWPVRTQADLSTIIKKTRDWQANRDAAPFQDALLIAQATDSNNLDFDTQLDMRVDIPLSRLQEFDTISRISMQELNDSEVENPIQNARESIEEHLNQGLELLSFSGHGSFGSWGFQGVVNTDFVKNLSNAGKPTLVMPLACYTSNYEDPSVNTLAHQWLFAGDLGAVGVHGAAVLGEFRENAIFAERYLNNAAASKTVGEAIYRAKNEMASGNQMLHNWTYLGDPTLPLR